MNQPISRSGTIRRGGFMWPTAAMIRRLFMEGGGAILRTASARRADAARETSRRIPVPSHDLRRPARPPCIQTSARRRPERLRLQAASCSGKGLKGLDLTSISRVI
jgi:hypothetical protein